MQFKEFLKLQEMGTATNSVAVFAQPVGIGTVQREPLKSIGFQYVEDDKKKKKKK